MHIALFLMFFLLTDATQSARPTAPGTLALAAESSEPDRFALSSEESNQEPPGKGSAPFGWDIVTGTESTPGTSLTLKEIERVRLKGSTAITYEVRAEGFSLDDNPVFVQRLMNERYVPLPMVLDKEDPTLLRPKLTVASYVPGEAVDVALFTRDGSKHAQARVFPFPIEAQGNGGCSATVQAILTGGRGFTILLQGFAPGEVVQVLQTFKKKESKESFRNEKKGILFRVTSAPKDRGEVSYTATGTNCSVTISHKVGKDAVVVQ